MTGVLAAVLEGWFTRQLLFNGLVNGMVFGLVAMGIVLVYRSTRVINFAVANIGFLAFPAIILGGLDSIGGALVGGLLIAGTQNFVQLTFGAEWVNIISFAIMLAILLVRPSGLFGRAEIVRL